MKRLSLTARMIAVVVACELLLTAGVTAAAFFYARAELHAAFDAALTGRATGVLALVRYTETNPPGLLFDRSLLPPASGAAEPDLFLIRDPSGKVVATGGAAEIPDPIVQAGGSYADFALGGAPYRAVALRNVTVLDDEDTVQVPTRVTVVYAASLADMNWRLERLALSVAGTSLLLLLAASALAAWGVRRGLRPLHDLAAQAEAISVRNWTFDPADDATARELKPLAAAIGALLDRLQESFRRQRNFTSDAAHELKTSVAILKSTLQSLLQRPRGEQEYRAGLEESLEDCERLEDLLERMLRLARIEQQADSGHLAAEGVTELSSTCEAAISRLERMAEARNVRLELADSLPVHLRADPKDLELIWVNLLENAVQYSPEGSAVILRIERNGGSTVRVSVDDSGPGVPSAELAHIFERFRRGDPSRARSSGGFGLGLAICKALTEAYGGRIEARNLPRQGARVSVEFPIEPEPRAMQA